MSRRALTVVDIKKFLKDLSDSIKLDQIYVDSLPRYRFSRMYNDGLWRDWRRDHCAFIEHLLVSADAMRPSRLQQLTRIAENFETVLVAGVILEVLAENVGGCLAERCGTAQNFFGLLIKEIEWQGRKREGANRNAPEAMSEWLSKSDPLAIARDPECGYDVPGARERSRPSMRCPAT